VTTDHLKEIFKSDDYEYEFLKFERVENKTSQRADIHAFMLLDKLVPGDREIVSDAQHDQISLETDLDKLAAAATEDQIVELMRCGVFLESEYDTLAMFK